MSRIPRSVSDRISRYREKIEKYSPKLAKLYENCYPSTLMSALSKRDDGSYFVLTGDIPAMWLRDSTAQVSVYIPLAKEDPEIAGIIKGVISRQLEYILIDPYANAFNEEPNGKGHTDDRPKNGPWVFERKYEIDSLCYPMRLAYLYVKATGDTSILDDKFFDAANRIADLWKLEQNHFENSPYRFFRDTDIYNDTIHNDGMGEPVAYTGMTWSGFRPSDDACTYGYLIPSNMFAVVVLGYIARMTESVKGAEDPLIAKCKALSEEIDLGIRKYGIVDSERHGKIFACEADGLGNVNVFDDANIPSLLSIPYIGYLDAENMLYQNTRSFILSSDNPYYYEGKFARGVGSPHTPENYVWHLALSMQGLTSTNSDEKRKILAMLENTDADTGFMHEGFDADDPSKFTREWFCWSNSLFAEFVEKCVDDGTI